MLFETSEVVVDVVKDDDVLLQPRRNEERGRRIKRWPPNASSQRGCPVDLKRDRRRLALDERIESSVSSVAWLASFVGRPGGRSVVFRT